VRDLRVDVWRALVGVIAPILRAGRRWLKED
jgi:hypothetical protein